MGDFSDALVLVKYDESKLSDVVSLVFDIQDPDEIQTGEATFSELSC